MAIDHDIVIENGKYWLRTSDMRFVNRTTFEPLKGYEHTGTIKGVRILQQRFVRLYSDAHEEWRDVPLVDENATPKTTETQA
jgi:hypothetical protein